MLNFLGLSHVFLGPSKFFQDCPSLPKLSKVINVVKGL